MIKSIMKRKISVLLSFLLICSLLFTIIPVVPAQAEGTATLTVENVSVNAGDTITVDVSIANCPIFYGIALHIYFDTTALELTSITRGPATTAEEGTFTATLPKNNVDGDYGVFMLDGSLYDEENKTYYMTADDGVLFTLTFAVESTAGSGDYDITIVKDDFIDPNSQPLDMTITNGVISVTGDQTVGHAAYYDGRDYLTVKDAIDAVVSAGGIGTITMINDTTIETYGDRIIIPANAEITLDMNSHIITSAIPSSWGMDWSCVVEVEKDGKLNLTDRSEAKVGQFIHATGQAYTRFLVNSGTLNMSNVDAINFDNGIVDGSWSSSWGGSLGTYGTISNCKFQTSGHTLNFQNANVDKIIGCTITDYGTSNGAISIKGTLNLLEDCTISQGAVQLISVYGTIGTIRDCTLTSSRDPIYISGGTVGKITSTSASKHTEINGHIRNMGTIGLIESDYTLVNGSILNQPDCNIATIAGGTFRSVGASALENHGTINSITGGVFVGGTNGYALYSAQSGASIGSVTGGYYKNTNSEFDLIYAVDGSTINIPEGYGFSSVPTTIEGEDGFYRLGKTVKITWNIDGAEQVDILFSGDPVSYGGSTPTKTGEGYIYIFTGWSDGVTLYRPTQTLPAATEDITYTAVFDEIAPEDDYMVSLGTSAENINAGEGFTVDVNITSNGNNSFYGATIGVTYDNTQVEYDSASTTRATNFGITSSTSGTTTTLKIVGVAQSGYTMTDHAYTVATLGFKVKSNITTGEATFGIKDNPIVDQQYAVHSQYVNRGDDISVNLWNLTVTFQAGANVNMATETAYVKYNEAGLYTDTNYETSFTEPVPEAADHYTLDVPVWKPESGSNVYFDTILGTAFTDNAAYTATASPSKFTVTLPEGVTVISGITDGKATYLTDIVFTVAEVPGYVNVVTYSVVDGNPVTLTADAEAKYTIPGSTILGSITVNVEHIVHGTVTFISNDNFKSLPTDYQVLLFTVDNKLNTGAYEYDGNAMFYSGKYSIAGKQVYLYVVPNEVTEDGALTKLQINATANPCIELAYDGNVNLDGDINSTDAVLTYALYGGLWTDDVFTKVNMRMRLEADVNGDKVVDTADAQKILNNIWGQ